MAARKKKPSGQIVCVFEDQTAKVIFEDGRRERLPLSKCKGMEGYPSKK